jgi:hypothetical protein
MVNGGDDVERIADEIIDLISGVISRVRSRTRRISPLVRGHGEIPGICERVYLGIPEKLRNAETMQREDQRIVILIVHRHVEHTIPGAVSNIRVSII